MGEGGGVPGFGDGNAGEDGAMFVLFSSLRPGGCNHPSDEGRAAAGRGLRWTSPHTLSSPIVRRWKGILRNRPAPPAGEGEGPFRPCLSRLSMINYEK
jgi:hypothetical protein